MIAEINNLPARYSFKDEFWWHVALFNAMVQHWDEYGRLATVAELAALFGKQRGTLLNWLIPMIKRGYVERTIIGKRKHIYTPIRHPAFVDSEFTPRRSARHARNAIVVECRRHLTSHVRLTYCDICIVVEYGALIQHLFKPQYFEVVYFSEHPEVHALRSGADWDWAEVRRLTITAGASDSTKPLTVCLMENKMRWVDEAIQRGIAI